MKIRSNSELDPTQVEPAGPSATAREKAESASRAAAAAAESAARGLYGEMPGLEREALETTEAAQTGTVRVAIRLTFPEIRVRRTRFVSFFV